MSKCKNCVEFAGVAKHYKKLADKNLKMAWDTNEFWFANTKKQMWITLLLCGIWYVSGILMGISLVRWLG